MRFIPVLKRLGPLMMSVLCISLAHAQKPDSAALPRTVPTSALVAASFVGAVAGVVVGAKLGYDIERANFPCSCDDPGLMGGIAGAFIGPAVAIPLAVHIADRLQGSVAGSLPKSLLIGAGGYVVTYASGGVGILMVPVLPIFESVLSIRTERRTAKD